jgi:acyl carrier protein
MDVDQIRRKTKDSISRITGIPVDDISDTASYRRDLGLDSLAMLEIAVDAEYEFGVKLPDERLPDIETVDDAVRVICEHLAAQAA